jgi:hypothetical protein
VRNKLRIEDGEKLAYLLNARISFFQNEAENTKQRLQALQNYLSQMDQEREHLKRGATSAEDFIKEQHERQLSAEQEIDKLRQGLREARGNNQKIEYEIKTMLDMIAFYKHAYSEEVNEYRQRPKGAVFSSSDLNAFYRNELENAIRQIRQDFHTLNEQQIKEYKEYKENELAMIAKQVEHDRMIAEQSRNRLEHNANLENAR